MCQLQDVSQSRYAPQSEYVTDIPKSLRYRRKLIGFHLSIEQEIPDAQEKIRRLKMYDTYFVHLYEDYEELNKLIEHIEQTAKDKSERELKSLRMEQSIMRDTIKNYINKK